MLVFTCSDEYHLKRRTLAAHRAVRTHCSADVAHISGAWYQLPGTAYCSLWTSRGFLITKYANVVVVIVVSLSIFTAVSVSLCSVLERLSRAPPGPPLPCDRATPAPHSGARYYRRKNGKTTPNSASGERRKRAVPDPRFLRTNSNGSSPVFFRACHGQTLVGRAINFLYDGRRPGPARQILRGWAPAQPGPSIFQRMGRGPAQLITLKKNSGPARPGSSFFQKSRPGPAHHMEARPMRHGLYMGRPDNYVGRPMCCPILKGACAYADVIFSLFFSSLCCNARSSSSNSSSTCCCNTRGCCNTTATPSIEQI